MIRARVKRELNLTLSVGVSYNKKSLQKMGSEYRKTGCDDRNHPRKLPRPAVASASAGIVLRGLGYR